MVSCNRCVTFSADDMMISMPYPRILGKISSACPPVANDGLGRVIIHPIDPIEHDAGMGRQCALGIGNRIAKKEMAQS